MLRETMRAQKKQAFACSFFSAFRVVVFGKEVHRLEQLVQIDERAHGDERAEDLPSPEGARAEGITDAAAVELSADPRTDPVVLDEHADTQRQPAHEKDEQAEVHGLLAVVTARDGVDVRTHRRHDDKAVDAEGDDGQEDVLDEAAVGLELHGRRRRGRRRHGSAAVRADGRAALEFFSAFGTESHNILSLNFSICRTMSAIVVHAQEADPADEADKQQRAHFEAGADGALIAQAIKNRDRDGQAPRERQEQPPLRDTSQNEKDFGDRAHRVVFLPDGRRRRNAAPALDAHHGVIHKFCSAMRTVFHIPSLPAAADPLQTT